MPERRTNGPRIRELREEGGYRQRELARLARCSAGYLREIEHGRGEASKVLLHRIAAALEVTIHDITSAPEPEQSEQVPA